MSATSNNAPSPTITIVTPTYNRGSLLPALFDSIRTQGHTTLDWIIIDDGSTDDTAAIVNQFQAHAPFNIIYHHQANLGKHVALNNAMPLVKTPWIMVVDSDDVLIDRALSKLHKIIHKVDGLHDIGVITAIALDDDNRPLIHPMPEDGMITDYVTFRGRMKYYGDTINIYRSEILKKYPFPVFEGEKFCPEDIIKQRVALSHKTYFTTTSLTRCVYHHGGLSHRWVANMIASPRTVAQYYSEASRHPHEPWKRRQIHRVLFWTYTLGCKIPLSQRLKMIGPAGWIHILPASFLRLYYNINPGCKPVL